jgi:hypothetical protein
VKDDRKAKISTVLYLVAIERLQESVAEQEDDGRALR